MYRGPDKWLGTEVIFRLVWKEDQTFVIFKHANWKEPVEFMHHCTTKWATFLLSLRDWLERTEGRPTPLRCQDSCRRLNCNVAHTGLGIVPLIE
jgi:hypothetical protein